MNTADSAMQHWQAKGRQARDTMNRLVLLGGVAGTADTVPDMFSEFQYNQRSMEAPRPCDLKGLSNVSQHKVHRYSLLCSMCREGWPPVAT
jgi:hypothetical protein